MRYIRPILIVIVISGIFGTLSSCNKQIDADNPAVADIPSNIPNNTPVNTIAFTTDSAQYSWKAGGTSITNSGITRINVEGAESPDNGGGVGFTLTNITQPGMYDVLANGTVLKGVTMSSENITSGQVVSYSSNSGAASAGKFIIQFISADSLKATFTATLTKESGSASVPSAIHITGSVNISFQKY